MRFDFDDIDAARQAIAGLNLEDKDEFWEFIQKALVADTPGTANFMGDTVTTVDCDGGPEDVILPLGVIPEPHRNRLEAASHEGAVAPRGTVRDGSLFLYCGPKIGRGRLYVTSLAAFSEYLDSLFPGADLTPAERSLVADLMVGFELRQSADRDGVSYETKRTLLKRALSKTSLSSQSQLASRVLSSFLIDCHDALLRGLSQDLAPIFRDWVTQYLPASVRTHTVLDDQDDRHHLIDFGPADGTPVIGLMPTIFPFIHQSYIDAAERLGLRIVMPLRRGALDPSLSDQDPQDLMQSSLRGVVCASNILGQVSAIWGASNACTYAVAAARHCFSSQTPLILVSPLLHPEGPADALVSFRQGFIKLAGKAPRLRKLTLRFLKHKIATPESYRDFLLSLAKKKDCDSRAIQTEFSDPKVREAYHKFAQTSFALFLADNHPDITFKPSDLERIECPITIIHGSEDELTTPEIIQQLQIYAPSTDVVTLAKTGHIMRFEAFTDCLSEIRTSIDRNAV